jgi:hypothetical protein
MLKLTRFEAVRRNRPINFLVVASGANWIAGTDSNNNGSIDAGEKQILINGVVALLPPGTAPGPAAILAKLGATSSLDGSRSGVAGTITFDARGAVSPLAAYVFYLGNGNNPEFGFRAVILLPSGATQIWTAPNGGTWQRLG